MEPTHRFLRACLRLPVDRTPVWMMRQAGRYLPQYRAIRQQTTFLGLLKNPDLATEVTLQPIDAFPLDAAILFSDILVPLEAMGMKLEFLEGEGPHLDPVRDRAGIDRLGEPDPEATMPYVYETIRRIKKALAGRVPLIGFAGAPFTLASYAVEGGTSKSFVELKRLIFGAPDDAQALLDKLARVVARYLEAQIAAGAEALQLFDTWGGILSPADFETFALAPARAVLQAVRASVAYRERPVPLIYFVNGVAPYLDRLRDAGADVIGLDWKIDIATARSRLGPDFAVQGNLDPAALFAPADEIERRVVEILRGGRGPGHVFNLGHGIYPETPIDGVCAMLRAIEKHG
jgi:uroporphyrinogen decarboxylase